MSEREEFILCQLVAAGATRDQALMVLDQQKRAREQGRPARKPVRHLAAEGPLRGRNQFHQPYRVAGSTSLRAKDLLS